MKVENTLLEGCLLITPSLFEDARGTFSETYNKKAFEAATGLDIDFVQDNQSVSRYGVLRGLHYQLGDMAQAKLVRVIAGRVLDIVVDIRTRSSTYGRHISVVLDAEKRQQLFVPRGFAHGFITLSKKSVFAYKCDNYYDKEAESGIIYNDATLSIDWHLPEDDFIISEKDLALPRFEEANT